MIQKTGIVRNEEDLKKLTEEVLKEAITIVVPELPPLCINVTEKVKHKDRMG